MNEKLKEFIEKLKEHLSANEHEFHQHYEMCGDTEMGFYDEHNFDIDELNKKIDAFSETFIKENI